MFKSKKIFAIIPVFILFIFLSLNIVWAEGNKSAITTGDDVNIRSSPSTSAKVLAQLPKGAKVKIVDSSEDWYKVSYAKTDVTGWVNKQFLIVSIEAIGTGTIKGDDINVRSKADISSEVLVKLEKGTKVDIYARSGDWYKIKIEEDRFGWIFEDYIIVKQSNISRGVGSDIKPAVEPEKDIKESEEDQEPKDTTTRQQVVEYAKKYMGVRYVYGGTSPKGFDCSGFVQYVFKHFGVSLERTAASQGSEGTKISKSSLKPGDLVFFDTNGGHNAIEHVGIYIGDGKFIHASSGRSAHRVVISDISEGFYDNTYMTARRYLK